jgi:hypothetical protein
MYLNNMYYLYKYIFVCVARCVCDADACASNFNTKFLYIILEYRFFCSLFCFLFYRAANNNYHF